MHITCTAMEDEGTSTCAANFINSYWEDLVNVSVSESLLSQQPLSSFTSTQNPSSNVPACIHTIPVPPYTIWSKTSQLSLMFIAGFKPVTPFSPSPSPQFLQVHHTCTCTHRYVHMHTHALQHAHKLSLFIIPLYMYLSFPNLNDEQTHPHSESITSNQLVDSQRSTEPSKLHFLQQR